MTDCAAVAEWLRATRAFKADLLTGEPFAQLVAARMATLELDSITAYLDVLRTTPEEVETLADGVAVQESWMFRYPQSFESLHGHLAGLLARGVPTLDMLSIGCARGEEPVSMAVTARAAGWPAERVRITAIDASGAAIATARRGAYGPRALRTRPTWVDGWVRCVDDRVQVDDDLLSMIDYCHADALDPQCGWPTDPAIVCCRNILIYLDLDARTRLIERIRRALSPGGWLMLGHSEHVDLGPMFEPTSVPGAFAWQRVEPVAAPSPVPPPARAPAVSRPAPRPVAPRQRRPRTPVEPSPPVSEPRPTLDDARRLADRGDLPAARNAARAVIDQGGPDADALALLGTIEMALGAVDTARQLLRKAVYLDPNHHEARMQLELLDTRPRRGA